MVGLNQKMFKMSRFAVAHFFSGHRAGVIENQSEKFKILLEILGTKNVPNEISICNEISQWLDSLKLLIIAVLNTCIDLDDNTNLKKICRI